MRITSIAIFLIIAGWISAFAQNSTHTVRTGETLFSISRQYDVSVLQLREWNNLNDNTIRVGMTLVIRSGSTADDVANDSAAPIGNQQGNTITHIVEAGQTLFRISRMYDVSVEDLKAWNTLENNALSIGQELTIRTGASSANASQTTARNQYSAGEVSDAQTPENSGATDRVADYTREAEVTFESSGDAASIEVANENWHMESTPQGRFVTYKISEKDSLRQLLYFHKMDGYDFRALNPGTSPSDIKPGDELTLLLASSSSQKNPYRLRRSERGASEIQVSRYPDDRRGKTTTSGDLYNPNALTAAHPGLALGSVVYVENPETGHGIFVLINDRTSENRLLLSDAAFRALQFENASSHLAKIDEQPD